MIRKIIFYLFIIIASILVLTLMLGPTIATRYINKNGSSIIGREVSIEKIQLNYLKHRVTLNNATIYEANGSDVFLSFHRLHIDAKLLPLLRNEIYVEQLSLESCHANLMMIEEGIFNFADLIATEDTIQSDADVKKESYKLNLRNIHLKDAQLSIHDQIHDHRINLRSINFDVPKVIWNEPDGNDAKLTFELPQQGRFNADLNYNIESGMFHALLELDSFDLQTILPYLQTTMNVNHVDGKLSSELFVKSENHFETFEVEGKGQIDDFTIYDQLSDPVVGFGQLRLKQMQYSMIDSTVSIDSVILHTPNINFALFEGTNSIINLLKQDTLSTDTISDLNHNNTEEASPIIITMNHFRVDDGDVNFKDQRFDDTFAYHLADIKIEADSLSNESDWLALVASMKLNEHGNLQANIGINPQDIYERMSIDYVIENFKLPDVNIYSKTYTGVPILLGDMYYKGSTSVNDSTIESSNKLIIKDVELGQKRGGLYNLPLKLALYILKDKHGDITLDVPVQGDLSDPQVTLGKIIFTTLKNFTLKVATSPFKALGNTFGVNPEELKSVDLTLNDTILSSKAVKTIDALAKIHKQKPELAIELLYINDEQLETQSIYSTLSEAMFQDSTGLQATSAPQAYAQFLKKQTKRDSLSMQDYEQLLVPEDIVSSKIEQNKRYRLNQVNEYLSETYPDLSIKLNVADANDVRHIGSNPQAMVLYTLAKDE